MAAAVRQASPLARGAAAQPHLTHEMKQQRLAPSERCGTASGSRRKRGLSCTRLALSWAMGACRGGSQSGWHQHRQLRLPACNVPAARFKQQRRRRASREAHSRP